MSAPALYEFGSFLRAAFHGILATGVETTSPWGIRWRWDVSFQQNSSPSFFRVREGDGCKKSLSVGMHRISENLFFFCQLHNNAEIHNGYSVGDELYYRKVVGDKEVCEAKFFLQIHKLIEYLALYGYVKGADRLVTDNELWGESHGSSYAYSLPLPSRELVRITKTVLWKETCFHDNIPENLRESLGKQA